MTGKVLELDSRFRPKKCGRRRKGLDRISMLPDDIIVYILSFLPLKEVVATSLVSRRWSHLWRYTPNLIFKNTQTMELMIMIPVSLKNIEWVNSVLTLHKALSLSQFEISFYVHEQYHYQVLTKWLSFAFSRRVERLSLNFECATSALDCNILGSIPISDYKFLKKLKLEYFNVSGEAIEVFLRNSPVLEWLIIRNVALTSDLVVCGASLKYLQLSSYRSHGITTKVSAPNLTRLYCCYELKFFVLENVPNLVTTLFELSRPDDTMLHFAKAASKLETLTLFIDNPKVFPVPEMPRLRKLVVDILFRRKEFPLPLPVTHFLQASPCLENFILKVRNLEDYQKNNFSRIFEVPKDGNQFEHHHLKFFEFSGFCGRAADHRKLLRYIGDSCSKVLEKIIIVTIPPALIFPCVDEDNDDFINESDCKESPYLVWTGTFDRDVVAAKRDEAERKIYKWTKRVVAKALPNLPNHVELSIYNYDC